ncbi:hypothetical protein [Alteromonas ponticola]|uniref:Uncharacterized protein n=1 Tax=Alteromonas ponticola TaxID=2720613 RepID=A0ABX1R2N0_9ALTE|nr:hypothetical protein [Alteromonas ponticola]NMH59440.1 hypothetical protein [Alteromonas ponticola]
MSAVELLESLGANADINAVDAGQQFWSVFESEKERFEDRKLWCVIHPDKDPDDDEDDGDEETSIFVN